MVKVCLQCSRPGFNPCVGKIPWRGAWQPTPVFLPGESPWTEEPSRLQSMGSQTVGHSWATKHSTGQSLRTGGKERSLPKVRFTSSFILMDQWGQAVQLNYSWTKNGNLWGLYLALFPSRQESIRWAQIWLWTGNCLLWLSLVASPVFINCWALVLFCPVLVENSDKKDLKTPKIQPSFYTWWEGNIDCFFLLYTRSSTRTKRN